MKKYLLLASIILFSFGYMVSDVMFDVSTPEGLMSAWKLRMILISVYTLFLFVANISPFKFYEVKQISVISVVSIGIVTIDIINKILDINIFNWTDMVFIALLLVGSLLYYYPEIKTKIWLLTQKKSKH